MSLSAAITLWAAVAIGQETKSFEDRETGFSFAYPATWEYRKERLYSVFSIPLAENRKAEVQVINTPFRGKADAWQQAQADVAKTMTRTIERQWEEVLLGVPLLMTQLGYTEGGKPMGSLVGLVYSRTAVKMSFRMVVPLEGYPEAEQKWRGILNGLRTLSGNLPTVEDPTQVNTTPGTGSGDPRTVVLRPKGDEKIRFGKGDRLEPMDVLGQALQLRMARSTTLVKDDSGYWITHPKLKERLKLDFGAGGAADMRKSVLNTSAEFNTKYQSVTLREEGALGLNRSGSSLYRVFRVGATPEAPLVTLITGGHAGLYYWTTTYSAATEKDFRKEKGVLEEIHETLLFGTRG